MCDTILAPPGTTSDSSMLFGKNSDRQRNEAQCVEYLARADYTPGSHLSCTYITIEQVGRTHAVFLCRPFWMWGAEMGANEHGLVVGNEGLYGRGPVPEQEALTGMDLVRIALERASSADEALEVITTLLERHGQGGNCGHITPSYYHNGFIVADTHQALVVETLGREWVAQRVTAVRAISNAYSIQGPADRTSAGMRALVREHGGSLQAHTSYAAVLADPKRQHLGSAATRRTRGAALLDARSGRVVAADMMRILRDHGGSGSSHPQWRDACVVERSLCMHAGADDQAGQTVGSLVSELTTHGAVHWVTATAAPCTGIFKPVLLDVPLPAHGSLPTDRFDARALWWRHERLHRAALLADLPTFLESIRSERDALEAQFQARVQEVVRSGDARDRAQVVADCWQAAQEAEERWCRRIPRPSKSNDTSYATAWIAMNELAGIQGLPATSP
jgi:secernin